MPIHKGYNYSPQTVAAYNGFGKRTNYSNIKEALAPQPLDLSFKSHRTSTLDTKKQSQHQKSSSFDRHMTDVPLDLRVTAKDLLENPQSSEIQKESILSALGLRNISTSHDLNHNQTHPVTGEKLKLFASSFAICHFSSSIFNLTISKLFFTRLKKSKNL